VIRLTTWTSIPSVCFTRALAVGVSNRGDLLKAVSQVTAEKPSPLQIYRALAPIFNSGASIGVRYLAKPSVAFFALGAFWITGVRDYCIAALQSKPRS
jgi:hypothetical protein